MMDVLMGIGDEIDRGLREFLGVRISGGVRGVHLDVDDYWEFLERHRHFDYYYERFYGKHQNAAFRDWFRLYHSGYRPEMDWRPWDWDRHCKAMGYPAGSNPVVIRVITKDHLPIETGDLPNNYAGYPIVYETRPPNRAISARDVINWLSRRHKQKVRAPSIGSTNPDTAGTLGGLLRGGISGSPYLVTAAHVLGSRNSDVYAPGPLDGKRSEVIGRVRHLQIPDPGATGDPCSEVSTPSAVRLDMAVAELSVNVAALTKLGVLTTANHLQGIAGIRKNDPVTFTGKARGRIPAKVGALTLWDQIEFPDNVVRCFGRLFEIRARTRQYVRQDLAQGGDSGSWLVRRVDELVSWYGMVISCDGGQAYACFSEYMLDECNRCGIFPGGLRLSP